MAPIVYIGIGTLIGLFLGSYLLHRGFKDKVNNLFKGIYESLSKLEFRQNQKEEDEVSYDNYHNHGAYCVLPNHKKLLCGFKEPCKDCPIYKTYKNIRKEKG